MLRKRLNLKLKSSVIVFICFLFFSCERNEHVVTVQGINDTLNVELQIEKDTLYSFFYCPSGCSKKYPILPLKGAKNSVFSYSDYQSDCCNEIVPKLGTVSIQIDNVTNDASLGRIYFFHVITLFYDENSSSEIVIDRFFAYSSRYGFIFYYLKNKESLSYRFPFLD